MNTMDVGDLLLSDRTMKTTTNSRQTFLIYLIYTPGYKIKSLTLLIETNKIHKTNSSKTLRQDIASANIDIVDGYALLAVKYILRMIKM